VAAGDVNLDGFADIVTGAGAGGGPHVKVFDGLTNTTLLSFFAFDAGFTGGVNVAAGDVTGDGFADVVVGEGNGGGSTVRVFDGRTGSDVRDITAFDPGLVLPSQVVSDNRYTSGVRVGVTNAIGGPAGIVVGTGVGRSPHVKVISFSSLGTVQDLVPFSPFFLGGVWVGGS
jgi:hypothetical protein